MDRVVCCENNHRFRLGICGDGYKDCPECNHLLKEVHPDVTKGEPFTLQYISQAFMSKKESRNFARNLSIDVTMNTDKLQLKLRAIAKHAEQLANELDKIDNAWQCDCGSFAYVDLYHDNTVVERTCSECNERYAYPNDDDLPTRLEGSE